MTNEIAELLREASHELVRPRSEYARHLHDRLEAAAASLEAQEPDYWVARSGPHIEFGMRRPFPEDGGANWCARTEVNQHINDRMGEQPGLRLHLEPLYRHPHTSAVPEPLAPSDTCDPIFANGWNACRGVMLSQGTEPFPPKEQAEPGGDMIHWAVDRWHEQVANRPLVNVYRRVLDSVWRQVIQQAGGDDVALCGPKHDDLLDECGNPKAAAPQQGGGEDE